MDTSAAVTALSALAQASRLCVFQHLVQAGHEGAQPSEIAAALDIPSNTLSFHLKALAHSGLITADPHGRTIVYRANFAQMQTLIEFLTANCCGGDASQCAPSASVRSSKKSSVKNLQARCK